MATNTSTNTTPESNLQTGGNDFLAGISKELIKQSGIVSSTNSELETRLNKAIAGVQSSADSSNKALQSEFERNATGILEKGNTDMTSGRAAGSGGLMNIAALRELTKTTDTNLKDLAMRKEELVLQNNAAAASNASPA